DWATGSGSGIDQVEVWIDGPRGSGLRIEANYGTSRPDVAQVFRRADLANSGFDVHWTAHGLASGQHTFSVYAHSTRGEWASSDVTVAAVAPPPVAYIPPPVAPPAILPPVAPPAILPPAMAPMPPAFPCTMDPLLAAVPNGLALC